MKSEEVSILFGFSGNDADPMSRNKNVFTSVDRHLYLASVTYMAGKDKKKFRSHERQKISPRRYRPIVFFLLSIYLVEVPESDSIISLLIKCVTK